MTDSIVALTLHDVDLAISAGVRGLRFSAPIEHRFEADTGLARRRSVIFNNAIGLATYEAFLGSDYFMVADIFRFSLILHLAVMLPTMVLVNVIVSKTRQVWLRESVLACGIVLTTSAILLLTLMSRSPLRDYEHFTIVLAILFATIVQKIRFWYAAAGCTTSLLLTVAALSVVYAQSPERMLFAGGTLACVVLFALVGSYGLEREQRMGYLLRLRDRLRTEELEVVNLLDPLTGIGNRRALDRKIAGCSTESQAVAILLIDIDHFKAFNDTNGHQAGDACLVSIAHSIESAIRADDRAYRYGGEEFLVFLSNANADDAAKVGERIRKAVAAAAITRGDDRGSAVTVSIGVSASSSAYHDDFIRLIGHADEALYAAKRKGRDRIEAVTSPEHEVVVPFMRRGDRR